MTDGDDPAIRLRSQPLIDGSPAPARAEQLVGQAAGGRELDADELAAIASRPATECERCRAPFDGDRYLLEITGHYVSGSSWELCTACASDLFEWIARPALGPRPPGRSRRQPRKKHQ